MVDAAAMSPVLQAQSETPYFRACADERELLRRQLADTVGVDPGQVVITANTSSGFAGVLGASALSGACVHPMGTPSQHYPGYRQVLAALAHDATGCRTTRVDFHTHVAPTTGYVDDSMDLGQHGRRVVVDGAQSFGTALTDELIARSHVALAPLHKHLVGAAGLGVAIIDRDLVAGDDPLVTMLRLVEHGCVALELLQRANGRLRIGGVRNQARIRLGTDEHRIIGDLGLEVVGDDPRLPMRCVRPVDDVPVRTLLPGPLTNARHFEQDNTVRFSFWRTGFEASDAVDCTPALMDAVAQAARGGETR